MRGIDVERMNGEREKKQEGDKEKRDVFGRRVGRQECKLGATCRNVRRNRLRGSDD